MRSAGALIFASLMLAVSSARCQPYAYVTNADSGTVSVIDTRTDKVTSTFNVPDKPSGIAASVDGARLYIGSGKGSLIERDLYRDKDVQIAVGRLAGEVRRSPDGRLLAIVSDDGVVLVDMAMLRVIRKISGRAKNSMHAVFSPDGRWIYADTADSDSVEVIDVAKGAVIQSIRVGRNPQGIGFLRDGTRAYVVVADTNEVVVIDVARRAVVGRIKSTTKLNEVAVHPDGKRLFMSAAEAGSVHVLDVHSNRFIAEIQVGAAPSGMAFTSDGSKLYVACASSNDVSVVDTSAHKRIQRIPVGQRPSAILISEPNVVRDGD